MKLTPLVYENQADFTQALLTHLGKEVWQPFNEIICTAAAVGCRRFPSKLGWLSTYKQEIEISAEIVSLIEAVEKRSQA